MDTQKIKRFIHWIADVLKASSDGLETVINKWPADSPFDSPPKKKDEGTGRTSKQIDSPKK